MNIQKSSVNRYRKKANFAFFSDPNVANSPSRYLGRSKIGDEGMRHLADALARGAAPALEWLIIRGNPASDATRQALRDARPNALPGLQIFL